MQKMYLFAEIVSLLSCAFFFPLYCFVEMVQAPWGWTEFMLLPVFFFAAILLADFMSGLAHWGFDSYGSPNTFFLGKNFIAPFREHHTDPQGITRHGFIETNGNSAIPLQLVLVIPTLLWRECTDYGASIHPCVLIFPLFFQWAILLTNQIHKWAHTKRPPHFVRHLQKLGIILSPIHHARHHIPPFESHYCITTGWLDAFLERIGFFRKIEQALAYLFGAEHQRKPVD